MAGGGRGAGGGGTYGIIPALSNPITRYRSTTAGGDSREKEVILDGEFEICLM